MSNCSSNCIFLWPSAQECTTKFLQHNSHLPKDRENLQDKKIYKNSGGAGGIVQHTHFTKKNIAEFYPENM